MRNHHFDGSGSGTGETCLAVIDGQKCYQVEEHPFHDMGPVVDTCAAAAYPFKSEVDAEQKDWDGKQFPDGTYTVEVSTYGEQALFWEGYATNVSDALHKALDKREEELGGEE